MTKHDPKTAMKRILEKVAVMALSKDVNNSVFGPAAFRATLLPLLTFYRPISFMSIAQPSMTVLKNLDKGRGLGVAMAAREVHRWLKVTKSQKFKRVRT